MALKLCGPNFRNANLLSNKAIYSTVHHTNRGMVCLCWHYIWAEFVDGSRPCSRGFSLGSLVFLTDQQSFIRGGSAPRSKPLPFNVPFSIEKVPLLYTFHRNLYPFHIPTEKLLLNFSLQKPLKVAPIVFMMGALVV